MIFVGGLSGSGKTTLAERLVAEYPKLTLVRASAVLQSLGRPVAHLTKQMAEENQEALSLYLQRYKAPDILDGHGLLIINEEPFIYNVPGDFFRELGPSLVLCIGSPPHKILSRRAWPLRFRSLRAMSDLQRREREHLKQAADELGSSFSDIAGDDYAGFAQAIFGHLGSAEALNHPL